MVDDDGFERNISESRRILEMISIESSIAMLLGSKGGENKKVPSLLLG